MVTIVLGFFQSLSFPLGEQYPQPIEDPIFSRVNNTCNHYMPFHFITKHSFPSVIVLLELPSFSDRTGNILSFFPFLQHNPLVLVAFFSFGDCATRTTLLR